MGEKACRIFVTVGRGGEGLSWMPHLPAEVRSRPGFRGYACKAEELKRNVTRCVLSHKSTAVGQVRTNRCHPRRFVGLPDSTHTVTKLQSVTL